MGMFPPAGLNRQQGAQAVESTPGDSTELRVCAPCEQLGTKRKTLLDQRRWHSQRDREGTKELQHNDWSTAHAFTISKLVFAFSQIQGKIGTMEDGQKAHCAWAVGATVNFAYNDIRRASKKCPYSRSVVIPEVSL